MHPYSQATASSIACVPRSEEAIPTAAGWQHTWLGQVMDVQRGPLPVPRNQVEAVSQQLRRDLRSALRHAYLGPKCAALLAGTLDTHAAQTASAWSQQAAWKAALSTLLRHAWRREQLCRSVSKRHASQERTTFTSRLTRAHLPCCCRLDGAEGELPPAFEAEERSWPGCGDLLQLVSGRTLLGYVRELSPTALAGVSLCSLPT